MTIDGSVLEVLIGMWRDETSSELSVGTRKDPQRSTTRRSTVEQPTKFELMIVKAAKHILYRYVECAGANG
jgi:hypothetical protein